MSEKIDYAVPLPVENFVETDPNSILQIGSEIRSFSGSEKEKRTHFEEKYPDFARSYPTLFVMCCQDNFDIEMLKFFVSKWRDVKSNRKSQHDASVDVGQRLADKYVNPLFKENAK
jgi:hypothetical protein